MASTFTIRDLDEAVEEKLRVLAALHGRSMEAEVREILAREVKTDAASANTGFAHLVGLWKGRGSTDELMTELRGE